MPEYMDRTSVLAVLAEQLSDNTLERLFPEYSTAAVRALLHGAKERIEPVPQQKQLSSTSTGSRTRSRPAVSRRWKTRCRDQPAKGKELSRGAVAVAVTV